MINFCTYNYDICTHNNAITLIKASATCNRNNHLKLKLHIHKFISKLEIYILIIK
jgi:hypothetical protein